MNQRMLVLATSAPVAAGGRQNFVTTVTAPPSAVLAPSGWYLLTAINDGVPSPSSWIHIG